MNRRIDGKVIAALLIFSSCFYGQVIDTKFGKAEIIGLKHWSLERLLDTLSVKFPGLSVDKCAANLKDAGFADASVIRYFDRDKKFYSVVTIIEPEFSKFVKYKDSFSDTLPNVKRWENIIKIFNEHPFEFQIGLLTYNSNLDDIEADTTGIFEDLDKQTVIQMRDFLKSQKEDEDRDLAVWTLNNDGNYQNRIIASAVLINFPQSNLVWWSLVDGLRDPDGRVCSACEMVLKHFAANNRRRLDWEPIKRSLTYLINGTNPFVFLTVLRILSETDISENVVRYLFKESGGYLILSYLKANHEIERAAAHDFLCKVFGSDFGYDNKRWEQYIIDYVR